jgi:hypothetical protein
MPAGEPQLAIQIGGPDGLAGGGWRERPSVE